jgi:hypothetical protein
VSWARIDDRANEHPKLLKAGAEAAWFWVCGLLYCNRQEARDGFIPDFALPILYPAKNPKRLAQRLVDVKLWIRVDGGYVVHEFTVWNETKEEKEARRAADRERKRSRANQATTVTSALFPQRNTNGPPAEAERKPRALQTTSTDRSVVEEAGNGQRKPDRKAVENEAFPGSSDPRSEIRDPRSGSDQIPEPDQTRAGARAGEAGPDPARGVQSEPTAILCPPDLQLTEGQLATLTMNIGITRYQVAVLTGDLVGRWVADPALRFPLVRWRQRLAKAITSTFSNIATRPPKAAPLVLDETSQAARTAENQTAFELARQRDIEAGMTALGMTSEMAPNAAASVWAASKTPVADALLALAGSKVIS